MIFFQKTYINFTMCILLFEVIVIIFFNTLIEEKIKKNNKKLTEQNELNEMITSDMKCFPVHPLYMDRIYYEDSFGAERIQGSHEGCDIIDDSDSPGQIPVLSCTDGQVTNIGWLFLGGYRIGITSDNDIYYYYAHLDSYAYNIKVGDYIYAGEFIGFMGNTGEGTEGTKGKFPTHLHIGIYQWGKSEHGINPYPYLKNLE